MAQPNDSFSNSVNNIRGLLHASIGDIDALLRGNPTNQTEATPLTQAERDTHTAQAADLEDALRRIKRLEGSLRFFQQDNTNTKKTFDNLKKDYQQLQANGAGPSVGSKEANLREEVRATKSSLANLQMKYTQLEINHRNASTNAASKNNNPPPSPPPPPPKSTQQPQGNASLQTRLNDLRTQYTVLEKVHGRCAATVEIFKQDRIAWQGLHATLWQMYHYVADEHSTCPAKTGNPLTVQKYDAAGEFGKVKAQLALLAIEHQKCGVQTGSATDAELQQCQLDKNQLEAEKQKLTAQKQKLTAEKKQLTDENARYRDIIVNSKRGPFGSRQPTDADLRASVSKIRTALLGIAYKLSESSVQPDFTDTGDNASQNSNDPNDPETPNGANDADDSDDSDDSDEEDGDGEGFQAELDEKWTSPLYRKTILWHLLYSRLDKKILSVPIFGLQDNPKSASTEVQLRALEGALEKQAAGKQVLYEKYSVNFSITHNLGLDPKIQEWRSRTVELASRFDHEPQPSPFTSLEQKAVNDLLKYLEPLISTMDEAVQARIMKSIIDVCAEAYKLKLTLRRFPDKIVFETVDEEVVANILDYQIMHAKGTKLPTQPVETITLMGALVKYPLEGGRIVLERPVIVIHEGDEDEVVPKKPTNPVPPNTENSSKKPAVTSPLKTTEIKYEKPTVESGPTSEEL